MVDVITGDWEYENETLPLETTTTVASEETFDTTENDVLFFETINIPLWTFQSPAGETTNVYAQQSEVT